MIQSFDEKLKNIIADLPRAEQVTAELEIDCFFYCIDHANLLTGKDQLEKRIDYLTNAERSLRQLKTPLGNIEGASSLLRHMSYQLKRSDLNA